MQGDRHCLPCAWQNLAPITTSCLTCFLRGMGKRMLTAFTLLSNTEYPPFFDTALTRATYASVTSNMATVLSKEVIGEVYLQVPQATDSLLRILRSPLWIILIFPANSGSVQILATYHSNTGWSVVQRPQYPGPSPRSTGVKNESRVSAPT